MLSSPEPSFGSKLWYSKTKEAIDHVVRANLVNRGTRFCQWYHLETRGRSLPPLTLWTLEIWNRDGLKVLILVVFRKSRPQKLPRSEQNLKTNWYTATDTSSAGCRGWKKQYYTHRYQSESCRHTFSYICNTVRFEGNKANCWSMHVETRFLQIFQRYQKLRQQPVQTIANWTSQIGKYEAVFVDNRYNIHFFASGLNLRWLLLALCHCVWTFV